MDVIFSPAPPTDVVSMPRRQRGHTLTETIIALAIAAVAVSTAVPSFAALVQSHRLTTSVNTLASALYYARSEAIKRNQPVVICKGNADTGCDRRQQWHDGWLVFVDVNGDKSWNGDEPLLWTQAPLAHAQTLEWKAFPSSNYVIYYPIGSASSNGTFTFCDRRGVVAAKSLIVAKSGRVRASDYTASGGTLECPS